MIFEYNSVRSPLILKEYGRNIQKMVAYLKSVEGKDNRTKAAHTLVELMKLINPTLKENPEYSQKVWDDLFIISGFELDVDAPYPVPEPEVLSKKPQRLGYVQGNITYRHYGKNVELLIEKAKALTDAEEKEAAVIYIGRLMRSFYAAWNKELVDESVIVKNIQQLSGNTLTIDLNKVKEGNLFEPFHKERKGGKNRRSSRKRKN
jgi:hypothetical protein